MSKENGHKKVRGDTKEGADNTSWGGGTSR